jgi:hypothetical protein
MPRRIFWAWGAALYVHIGPATGEDTGPGYYINLEKYTKPEAAAAVIKDFVRAIAGKDPH